MITLRARIFIVISVVVLLIMSVVIGLLWYSKRPLPPIIDGSMPSTTVPLDNQNYTGGSTAPGVITGLPVQPITTEAMQKNAAKQLARVFVERYGSYSTDSGYQNIVELEGMLTENLWLSLSKKIGSQTGGNFIGMTTRVMTVALSDWVNDKSATVSLQVVQTEEKNGIENSFNKNIDVKLIKSGDVWLVDSFTWKS